MELFVESDASPEVLSGERIAVLGYGSQGRAHALNLRDSGYEVVVGLRPDGSTRAKAENDGFAVQNFQEAVEGAGLIAFLTPDMVQAEIYERILPQIRPNATVLFAHGFNIHFGRINSREDLDVVLIAPKGPGDLVRRQYEAGRGVPCLIAVHQDVTGQAEARALAYAHGLGGTRGGVLRTTFAEETVTDLFGEQVVLCGGVSELVKMAFETLVEAGYQPEMAYFECLHELKLIVDLFYEGGLSYMRYSVSNTAEFGDYSTGERIINEDTRTEMRKVLKEIQDGVFARNWILENRAGAPAFKARRRRDHDHELEQVGRRLRKLMTWIDAKEV